ncbi:HypC/HybG/HupF family hydrogenase formation chaperone [Celeribacter sp.]|uniref:HypC/HybG/HupF family hydrogenase formation chaperone n=1 Tax=Celeribacter sp. TaxID=1890673 RepID=UPI003A937338
MCVGIPMQILSVDGIAAQATDGREEAVIDLSLVGPVAEGSWVLTFLGAAREVIDAEEARQISKALEGLRSVLAGGDLGDAFADLDAREPQLPPHLRQALENGETQA